jgi:outer membrane biosynthesis protein TonB
MNFAGGIIMPEDNQEKIAAMHKPISKPESSVPLPLEAVKSKTDPEVDHEQTIVIEKQNDQPEDSEKTVEISPVAQTTLDSDAAQAAAEKRSRAIIKVKTYFIGCFIILVTLILVTSFQNMKNYFLVARHGAVEIWKGTFSPLGRERVVIMAGVQPPASIKEVYTQEEVFPMAFNYYLEKADTLMDVPGLPDFAGIKSSLNRALMYATTDEMRTLATAHAHNIDRLILLYKADVAASRGSVSGLAAARDYLKQAAALNPDEIEANLIEQKLNSIDKHMQLLRPDQPVQKPDEIPARSNEPEIKAPETPPQPPPKTTVQEETEL